MSAGDVWSIPGGHRALEMPGSNDDELRLSVIAEDWPYPMPPRFVARSLCDPLPSRYLGGAVPNAKP